MIKKASLNLNLVRRNKKACSENIPLVNGKRVISCGKTAGNNLR
jgi:hypothetical protein